MSISARRLTRRSPLHALRGWQISVTGVALCAASLSAQTAHAVASHAPPHTPASDAQWLTVDAAARRARFDLRAGPKESTQPELNFNGASMGELEFRVPLGWAVELAFANVGQSTHSARVVSDTDVAIKPGPAALVGAETPRSERGQLPGTRHLIAFRATRAGRYRLSCAVPAHGYSGMWIYLTVDPTLQRPDIRRHAAAADGDGQAAAK